MQVKLISQIIEAFMLYLLLEQRFTLPKHIDLSFLLNSNWSYKYFQALLFRIASDLTMNRYFLLFYLLTIAHFAKTLENGLARFVHSTVSFNSDRITAFSWINKNIFVCVKLTFLSFFIFSLFYFSCISTDKTELIKCTFLIDLNCNS